MTRSISVTREPIGDSAFLFGTLPMAAGLAGGRARRRFFSPKRHMNEDHAAPGDRMVGFVQAATPSASILGI